MSAHAVASSRSRPPSPHVPSAKDTPVTPAGCWNRSSTSPACRMDLMPSRSHAAARAAGCQQQRPRGAGARARQGHSCVRVGERGGAVVRRGGDNVRARQPVHALHQRVVQRRDPQDLRAARRASGRRGVPALRRCRARECAAVGCAGRRAQTLPFPLGPMSNTSSMPLFVTAAMRWSSSAVGNATL